MRQKPRLRMARNALLWGLALFAGLQLGLAYAIEHGFLQYRDPWYADKVNRLQRRLDALARSPAVTPRPYVVVMLGSSRTGNGLKGLPLEADLARELGRPVVVLNLGVPGAGPLVELMNFKRLLAEGVRPDLLLVEVMPVFLGGQDVWEERIITADRLGLRDLRWLQRCGMPVLELRRAVRQSRWYPWYKHRFAIMSEVLPAFLPGTLRRDWSRGGDDSGWVPIPTRTLTPETRRRVMDSVRRDYAPRLRDFRLGGSSCQALRRILEECRRRELRAALVVLPEGSEYRSWYAPGAWNAIEAFLADLSRSYSVPVVNAREWIADEHLADSLHLLGPGAVLFTERLGRELVLPLLLSNE